MFLETKLTFIRISKKLQLIVKIRAGSSLLKLSRVIHLENETIGIDLLPID